MKNFLAGLLCLVSISVFSQIPGGQGGNRRGGMPGGGQANIGHFYGKVVDSKYNKGIDAASVQLIQNKFDTVTKQRKDVVIAGQLTTPKGEFSLENLPVMGQFKLRITAIGYVTYEQKVQFDMKPAQGGDFSQMLNNVDKDLGNIKINEDAKELSEVKVVATKPLYQMGVDRKIFNVEKNIVTTGQTATELMKNVPGVNVDIDGNVTLRNAAPTIFVDGRPTTLTLDQIPADAIESVEIITNPSAKFDASGGTAGILNIVLKKNRKAGYNGNIRAGIDSRGKLNGGVDFNVKQGKFNVFASLNYNQRKSISEGTTYRENYYTDQPDLILNQTTNSTSNGAFAFGRLGFDYLMDNRNTLTVSASFPHGKFKSDQTDHINVDTLAINPSSSYAIRHTLNDRTFTNIGPAIGYKHLFPKQGRELTADVNYNRSTNSGTGNYSTQNYETDHLTPIGDPALQLLQSSGSSTFITIQSDYTSPMGKTGKLESGVRAAIRNNKNINTNLVYVDSLGTYVVLPNISSNYKFTDQVYAAYGTYSNSVGKTKPFTYQVGLRVESSKYDGTLISTGEKFSNQYPFELFPSVFLTKNLGNGQDLQANYSRRINRPNFFQLIPYYDVSDLLNISVGNPNLKPEFTNSFEVNYSKTFAGGHSLLTSVYFKQTNHLITRYQTRQDVPLPDGKLDSVIVSTYINANSSQSYGLEITSKNPIASWVDVTTNLNFFNARIDNSGIDSTLGINSQLAFFGKMNFNFKLPGNFTIQLSGDYQSRTIAPPGGSGGGGFGGGRGGGGFFGGPTSASQGYINPTGGVDIAFRKEFMKDRKASLTLAVNDIFKTRVQDVHSENAYFLQDYDRRRDWRVVRLNFAYRFGKFDVSLFKRKNTKSGAEGLQEGIQMQQ
ncbi:MAG: TonB-dependent receptor [Bacteroidetes bacterium]|nr:MAG: TonB-dependent receptor [Bacteroidota bacterium]